jgi:hypothetical protein
MNQSALQPTDQSAAAPNDAPPPAKHIVTEGEKKFDRQTYWDIGYALNAAISVLGVYAVERTKGGQKMLQGLVDLVAKIPRVDPQRAKFFATKSFLLSGGFAVLVPVKLMEDHKVERVKKLNREIYGPQADTDPMIRQSEAEVAAAPKQGWLSIFSSRALALVPFYAVIGLLWDRKSTLSRWTNPQLHALGKHGMEAMEQAQPAAFSKLAHQGIYFDRFITFAARTAGKVWATVTGDTQALANTVAMQSKYPSMVKHGVPRTERDGLASALSYFTFSEVITSAIVAWGVYALTRVMGPIFGKKSAPVTTAKIPKLLLDSAASAPEEKTVQPQTTIQPQGLERAALADAPQLAAAR